MSGDDALDLAAGLAATALVALGATAVGALLFLAGCYAAFLIGF